MDFGMDSLFVRWIMASDLISTSFFSAIFSVFFSVFFLLIQRAFPSRECSFRIRWTLFSFSSTSCTPELLEYFCSVNHQKWRFIKSK